MLVNKVETNIATSTVAPGTKTPLSQLTLPTIKSVPLKTIGEMTFLIYGEKKIGKTSFASQFPKAVFLMCEPGGKGLEIFQVPVTKWAEFEKYVDLICSGQHDFQNVIIDTVDALYQMAFERVCKDEAIEDPGDLGYGKGWNLVKRTFSAQIDKLVKSGYGVLFLSHATEKEYMDRSGGSFTKIIPSMPKQAKDFISGICDALVFYGYHGEERLLTIRGSDTVESGVRPTKNFWVEGGYEKAQTLIDEKLKLVEDGLLSSEKEEELDEAIGAFRVHSIPAGTSERESYINFCRAFENKQATNGSPVKDFANIEKQKPMVKEDKKK
jgi:hypothetical protein